MGYVTKINNETTARRNQLKSVMDDFCTFSWGGCPDMFGEYGAFVVGGKDALKFYNGPGFSNEYAQPQFNKAAGQLQGVNFTTQQISFTMGVYWITEEDYRKLIYLLHPLRVNFLAFGFETKYGYQAKLSKLGDSTRNPIGRNENGKIVYYTEIPLTFEVQGAQCAIAQVPFEWHGISYQHDQDNNRYEYTIERTGRDGAPDNSDLSFPIKCDFAIEPIVGGSHTISFEAVYKKGTAEEKRIGLFLLDLQSLTSREKIRISYESDLGVLFLQYGDGLQRILSLTAYTDIGEYLVKSYDCNKFNVPGILEQPNFNLNDVKFTLFSTAEVAKVEGTDRDDILIEGSARTNVI